MATTDAASILDVFFIKETFKYYPKKYNIEELLDKTKDGIIQRDRFVEMCMTNASEGMYSSISEDGRDHSDDSDTKTVTIQRLKKQKLSSKTTPMITIKKVGNKKGHLRVVAFDPKYEIFRFFYIWDLPRNHLQFSVENNSKYINGTSGIELKCFSDLAKYRKNA